MAKLQQDREKHWNEICQTQLMDQLSWYEATPSAGNSPEFYVLHLYPKGIEYRSSK